MKWGITIAIITLVMLGVTIVLASQAQAQPFGEGELEWTFTTIQQDELTVDVEQTSAFNFTVSLGVYDSDVVGGDGYSWDFTVSYGEDSTNPNSDLPSVDGAINVTQDILVDGDVSMIFADYHLIFPENNNITWMRISAGQSSTLIDGTASSTATKNSNSNSITMDEDGTLHVTYRGSRYLQYEASYDNGTTWVNKTQLGVGISGFEDLDGGGITNGRFPFSQEPVMYAYGSRKSYQNSRDYLTYAWISLDKGNVWQNATNIFFNFTSAFYNNTSKRPSCTTVGSVLQCCTTEDETNVMYKRDLTSSGTLGTQVVVDNANSIEECDIETYDDSVYYVTGYSITKDDMYIWKSSDGFDTDADDYLIVDYNAFNGFSDFGHSFTIGWDDTTHLVFTALNDLQYCNSTITDWNKTWSCQEVDSSASYFPSVTYTDAKEIFILYSSTATHSGDVFRSNSSDGGQTWTVRESPVPEASSGHANIRGSNTPYDTVNERIDFTYTSNSDPYYENITARERCTYYDGNWDINCNWGCRLEADTQVDLGHNITIRKTGTFTINSGVNLTGWNQCKIEQCQVNNIGGLISAT